MSDRAIDAALAEGARTVSAVCRATRAAQDCGTCITTVKALVCKHREQEATIYEVIRAAS